MGNHSTERCLFMTSVFVKSISAAMDIRQMAIRMSVPITFVLWGAMTFS
jgi:hypothetical protein